VNIRLVSFAQEVSFEDGSTTNVITMRLPNGSPLQAIVSDEGLASIIAVATGSAPKPAPPPAAPAPREAPRPPPEEGGDHTFGGDYRAEASAQPWAPDPVPGRPVVTTDEFGDPVVHDRGVDLADVLEGGGLEDEEGLGL
jgi:hypothetical protein